MGRPRKQTVDYFPHFVSTDSRTKFILEQNWGNDGYALWFKLLELLGRSKGHYYDCTIMVNKRYLVALMKMEESTIYEILSVLAELGNIDKELWEERQIIWSQSFVDNLQELYSKRTTPIPTRPFTENPSSMEPEEDIIKPTDKTEDKQKKHSASKKSKISKIEYAEFVKMTKEEHEKLITRYGEEKTRLAIEILDNYKGSSGKNYKSDYRAILNWVIGRVNEELSGKGGSYESGTDFESSKGFKER